MEWLSGYQQILVKERIARAGQPVWQTTADAILRRR